MPKSLTFHFMFVFSPLPKQKYFLIYNNAMQKTLIVDNLKNVYVISQSI